MPAKRGAKRAAPPKKAAPPAHQRAQTPPLPPRTPSPEDSELGTPIVRRLSARSKGKKTLLFEDEIAAAAEREQEQKEARRKEREEREAAQRIEEEAARRKEKEAAQAQKRASIRPTAGGDGDPFGRGNDPDEEELYGPLGALDRDASINAIKRGPLGGEFGRALGSATASNVAGNVAGNNTPKTPKFTPRGGRMLPPKPLKKLWGPSDRTQRIGLTEALAAAKAREDAELAGQELGAIAETPKMSGALQGGEGEDEDEDDPEVEEIENYMTYQDIPFYFCVYAELKAKKGSMRQLKWSGQIGFGHWTGRGHFSLERLNHEVSGQVERHGLSEAFDTITVKIRSAKSKTKIFTLTIDDFSEPQWVLVENALKSQWDAQPGYRQDVYLYIETDVISRIQSPSFRRPIGAVDTPNAPPTARRTRTVLLEEQAAHRQDRNAAAGDFCRDLTVTHRCTSSVCTNPKGGSCYVPSEGQWKGQHFHLTTPMQEAWANAIAANEATVEHPSLLMFDQMKLQRGPTSNEGGRAPQATRLTRAAMDERFDRYEERQMRVLEFKQVQQLGHLADDDVGSYGYTYPHPRPYPQPPVQYLPQPEPQLPPQVRPTTAQVGRQETSHLVQSMSELRSSSPIMDACYAPQIWSHFWEWKLRLVEEPDQKAQILLARDALNRLGYWKMKVLKKLSDPDSSCRREARGAGIAPGLMDDMASDISAFKPVYRNQFMEATAETTAKQRARFGRWQQEDFRRRGCDSNGQRIPPSPRQPGGFIVPGNEPVEISSQEESEDESNNNGNDEVGE